MPLYEYICQDCHHRFEILQRIGEGADGLSCPECGEAQLAKQFSTFASSSSESATTSGACAATGGGCGFT